MTDLYGSQSGEREIILTFDDGPHPVHTPTVLDALASYDIQALFFVLGNRLETETGQEILDRMSEGGHFIGNHTYSHPNLKKLDDSEIREEIQKTEALIGDRKGAIRIFRPPYGAHNTRVDKIVRELGYELMLWNVDTLDWHKDYRKGRWVNHGMEQIKSREDSIVLAHDIHASTANKVKDLIHEIRSLDNFSFPTYA